MKQNERGENVPIAAVAGSTILWRRTWKTEVIERVVGDRAGTFVDVGVNTAQTLIDLCLTHAGMSYIGFEPNVLCASFVSDLIVANGLRKHILVPAALGDENKVMRLYRSPRSPLDSAATTIRDLRPGREFEVDFISCFRFDDIRPTLEVGPVSFVKIDVEGSELEVVLGMQRTLASCRPVVLCEVLFTDSKEDLSVMEDRNERLVRALAGMKYLIFQIRKSPDDCTVVGLAKIDQFESAFWTLNNKDLCDYLFVPEEAEERISTAFSTS